MLQLHHVTLYQNCNSEKKSQLSLTEQMWLENLNILHLQAFNIYFSELVQLESYYHTKQ